ncbi:MAG: OsmC family protein [Fimbriimonadaceae bacterium]|nr:OsmC family protein [Fimbriimonadaceae bacterium]
MATVHEYAVKVEWSGGRMGCGTVGAERISSPLPLAVPPEFQGAGNGTNPEEMLACAICACYAITFGIIAENRKLPVASFRTEATGEVEQNGPQFKYRSVTIRPTIVLSADATDEQVALTEEMAHKADAYCIITNAVRGNVAIEVEPTIRRGP